MSWHKQSLPSGAGGEKTVVMLTNLVILNTRMRLQVEAGYSYSCRTAILFKQIEIVYHSEFSYYVVRST